MNIFTAKKKILWLAHEGNLSGANIAMLEYVDALRQEYDFHIVLPHGGNMESELMQNQISYTVIPQYGWTAIHPWWNLMKWLRICFRSIMAVAAMRQLIQKEKVDIVFTNTLIPFVAAFVAHRLQLPHVWWIHEFGEEHFGFKIGWGNQQWGFLKMQQWSNLIIGNSEAIAKYYSKRLPGANVKRLYQPVSWNAASVIVPGKIANYLMFGLIAPSKGHFEVLQAIAAIKEKQQAFPTLHIKGPCENPAYLNELMQFIIRHNLEGQIVIETGFFKKEEVIPMYEALIVASGFEAFGRVIVEANKAGVRVIVKNSGGMPELINETNGLVYNGVEELKEILSGVKSLPNTVIRQQYNEGDEIQQLKTWLKAI